MQTITAKWLPAKPSACKTSLYPPRLPHNAPNQHQLTIRSWKVLVMMKAEPQLVRTQTELANPFTREGKISDITSQGIGPQPREKPERTTGYAD
jgi:hypothetical protein